MTDLGSEEKLSPWLKALLDPKTQRSVNYMLVPIFFGLTTGSIYGGVTGVMMNMGGKPELQLRVLRYTSLFCRPHVIFRDFNIIVVKSYDGLVVCGGWCRYHGPDGWGG